MWEKKYARVSYSHTYIKKKPRLFRGKKTHGSHTKKTSRLVRKKKSFSHSFTHKNSVQFQFPEPRSDLRPCPIRKRNLLRNLLVLAVPFWKFTIEIRHEWTWLLIHNCTYYFVTKMDFVHILYVRTCNKNYLYDLLFWFMIGDSSDCYFTFYLISYFVLSKGLINKVNDLRYCKYSTIFLDFTIVF